MNDINEAHETSGKIYLNGWFRIALIGFAGLIISVLTLLTTNVIANDRRYMEDIILNKEAIARLEIHYSSIKDDLGEIKGILRRTSPFERAVK